MSVLVSNRKESQFEVFSNFYKMRAEITDLLLRDFGCKFYIAEKKILKSLGKTSIDELSEQEMEVYQRKLAKNKAFNDWFVLDERRAVVGYLRDALREIFEANSIYPTVYEEYAERRLHQDRAIGLCFSILQELQYAMEILPVDMNVYLHLSKKIYKEIGLLKSWRKADNRFKRVVADSASNFANVNNNGNANYNNASNSNGVRPDFDGTEEEKPFERSVSEKGAAILP